MAEQDNSILKLFGFEIRRAGQTSSGEIKSDPKLRSIVAPTDDDGAGYVTASGSHYGQFLDLEGNDARSLITFSRCSSLVTLGMTSSARGILMVAATIISS